MGSVPLNSCEPARPADTNAAPEPYAAAFERSFQQYRRSETLVLSGDLSGKLSSPAVQQLWTLYPGKQTANLMTNTQTPPPATTVVIPTGAFLSQPATNTVANHAERPEKFNGQNFKRWQQKMFFYLTTLGLARFLKETVPQVEPPAEGQSSNAQAVQAVEAWKHSDFLCHNYVLNGLIDPLYNVYCKTTTAKELWESLERKYKTEDADTKKFVVARFLDYKMVDSKNVIKKLPPSWVEFKNYLKHKRKEMSVEDLVVRLRIEEDNKLAQKDTYTPDSAKANMVEHAGSSSRFNSKGNKKDKKKNDKKGKGKSEYLAPKAGIVKQKFQGTCYNCDQPGHRAANCKMPKRVNPRQANMVDENVDMIAMVSDMCAMISEVNLVGTNNSGWWIDTGATRHVCADKRRCYFEETSEKELMLTTVLYVGNQMYVGKGYAVNAMFKLNVMVVKNDINKMNSSAYLIESSNVWHGRLGHETGSSSRLDDKVVQDKRQRDDNDLQDERQDQTEEEEVEPRRSKRARNEKSFGPDFVSFMVENEPTSYGSVGYKWIFKKKMKADGTVDKYKARLVIQGFRQREGLDYFDTYSPVTRITSIRMIIAIAALRNLEIHQMDVKTAFLNGDLEEEIYMNQPEGFIAPGQEGKIIRSTKDMLKSKFDYEITYVREKWGRFEGNCGGAIVRKLLQNQASAHGNMTGTDYEGLDKLLATKAVDFEIGEYELSDLKTMDVVANAAWHSMPWGDKIRSERAFQHLKQILAKLQTGLESITSIKCVLTQEHLDAICAKYFVPEEVHPQLPSSDATMHERPAGKVGMYTRFFDYANYRIPFSTFFVSVLTHFRIPFSQLSVFGSAKVSHFEILCRVCNIEPDVSLFRYFYTHNYKNGWFGFTKRPNVRACYSKNLDSVKNWNDHFFWVDEFVVPANARFSWFSGSNIVKDRAPAPSEYNVEHVNTLIAQASPFLRFPEEFLCWVGISRNYLLNKDTYPRFEYEDGEGGFYFPYAP
ncbi:pol polyprotein [Tanacetum coccineum]